TRVFHCQNNRISFKTPDSNCSTYYSNIYGGAFSTELSRNTLYIEAVPKFGTATLDFKKKRILSRFFQNLFQNPTRT
ncbi:MAG: hypothetical protein LBH85_08090, partial [Treponema sp.]|nr:hypothetical protein [Treponema sp.]